MTVVMGSIAGFPHVVSALFLYAFVEGEPFEARLIGSRGMPDKPERQAPRSRQRIGWTSVCIRIDYLHFVRAPSAGQVAR
ncbi:MAG: hypothetical protein EPN59_04735 [Paraburkholderia sp.]|uniref:hypothetical protein n=1 Tax=Paraburkholderia sp. TaxID=1926495 RepID=UPI00121BBE93|nr:hypothetical protein [Paraburkholderia sp.]TAM31456.1 MAG: hypothetical protein EPN59_04735 [Paraburkholderia sp.]